MKMLLSSTVYEFFRRRAGMFLILLGILFGFLGGAEHRAFALFFLTGSYGMLYLLCIWLIYALLCAQFLSQLWKLPEYTFIYEARLWPSLIRIKRLSFMGFAFLQPILYYGIYLISIAVSEKATRNVWPIFIYYLLLSALLAYVAEWRLRNPVNYIVKSGVGGIKWPFPRPALWLYWAFEWLFRERGITLLVGKLGPVLVATGTMLYYSTDIYDLRLPAIGLSLAYLLNFGISLEFFKWESEVCLWGRSMPVSPFRRFVRIVAFHAIIILPETLAAVRNAALSVGEIMQLYLLGLTILTITHLVFYKKEGLPEDPLKVFLFGFVGLTLLILYKIPLLLLIAGGMLFSVWIYPKCSRI
ncbi:hypothetical protein DYBT9623_01049 [Dyadobacter sp. CECT 9623]|uniref:Uncharacterized protein n=1 Tax=Dyadobacter linearis TaxID=2823330 RepID=A0ABN7R4K9_9BACT|nr:hypothetical protein [Dyadobacter sp. CECT 9623]CAG5068319.1 hypothetical protein DYBT9623_01049 [Dyadobacter sp. CECT 9623]